MNLHFASPHLSIQSFPTVDLPSFTLITGVNGAGKTHLLRAIADGHVQADVAPNKENDIRFFDWTTLVPNNTGEFQAAAVYGERDQILGWGYEQRQALRENIHMWASKHKLIGKGRGTTSSLLRLSQEELGRMIADPDEAQEAWREMQELGNLAFTQIQHHARNNTTITEKITELHNRFGAAYLRWR